MGKYVDLYISGGELGDKPLDNGIKLFHLNKAEELEEYELKHEMSGLVMEFKGVGEKKVSDVAKSQPKVKTAKKVKKVKKPTKRA
jgi:hypothetical protein